MVEEQVVGKEVIEMAEKYGIDQIVAEMGALIARYRSEKSDFERTREVHEALNTLLYTLPEKYWDEWIPVLAWAHAPQDFGDEDRIRFTNLLLALLIKFTSEVKGSHPGIRQARKKEIVNALELITRPRN